MAKKQTNAETLTELKFPMQGIDEQRPYARQRPGTTADAQNVCAFEQGTGRARGGQRPGLVKYCPLPVRGAIQDLNHCVTTGVGPPAPGTYGSFAYAQGRGFGVAAGTGSAPLVAGTSEFSGLGAVSGFAFGCSCWDTAGNLYVAEVNKVAGQYILYIVSSLGVVSGPFPTSFSGTCITSNPRAVAGMCVIGTNLYVATIQSSGGGVAIIAQWAITSTPGLVLNTGSYYVYDAANLAMTFSTNSHNCLGSIGVTLAVDSVGNGTNQGLILLNTVQGPQQAGAIFYGYGGVAQNNPSKVCSDGIANFYVLRSTATAQILKIGLGGVAGVTSWVSTAGDTANGLAFDVTANMLLVLSASAPFVRQLSLATGLSLAAVNPASQAWNEIDSDGQGNFVLWKNLASTNNVIGLNNTLGVAWGPVTLDNATQSGASVNKGAGVQPQQALGARMIRGLVVSNGAMVRFSSTGTAVLAGGGGQGFSPTAPIVFSAQNNLNVYYVDGVSYRYYNSILDQMASWAATSGTIPTDPSGACCRLIETWRGRTVIAGLPANPQQGYMSAAGDPNNWNFSPNTTTATQASAFTTALAGKPPDVINCIIPYADDTLIVGGAHSIRQLTGDPMAGGQWDTLSEGLGMAWGRAWCRDLVGQIYFFGSKAGIFKMTPGTLPVRISQPIEKEIENVDMSQNIIRMAWDIQVQALWVFITPLGGGATTHYLFEERTQAWWKVVFTNPSMNPLAVFVHDGDSPTDRVILLGGQDGYIRAISLTAPDDDGTPIPSHVFIGPMGTRDFDSILLVDMQMTLDDISGPVLFDIYVGTSAEDALSSQPVYSGTWTAGRNLLTTIRRYGIAIYVKLSASSYWAMEYLRAKYMPMGEVMGKMGHYVLTSVQQAGRGLPLAPTGAAAVGALNQATVSWNMLPGLTYNLYRSSLTSPFVQIAVGATSPYTDVSLTNGVTYSYRVTAVNAAGEGPPCTKVMTVPNTGLVPSTPSSPNAVGTYAAVILTWTAPDGAIFYNVYRSTTTGTETLYRPGITGTTFTDTGLTDGATFFYKITAVNAIGEGAASAEVSATATATGVPVAPTLVSAVAGNAQVTLTWTAVPGAVTYKLYRGTSSGGEVVVTSGIAALSVVDTGLTIGTQYFYEVKATNANGDSLVSNELSATPANLTVPAQPTTFAAVGGSGQVSLTWTQPAGTLLSYSLYMGTSPGGEGSSPVVAGIAVGASYIKTGLANSTTYYFTLTATNANGEGAHSSEASATTTAPVPSAPTGFAAAAGNGQVTLTWTAQTGITTFALYRELTNSGGVSGTLVTSSIAGTASSYTDASLTNGTQYFYYLKAVNTGGTSAASTEIGATPTAIVTYVQDGFAGTIGTLLTANNYAPNLIVPSPSPLPYWSASGTNVPGTFVSGGVGASAAQTFAVSQVPSAASYTITANMKLGSAAGLAVLAFIYQGANDFWHFGMAGTAYLTVPGLELVKHVAGVSTILGSFAHTLDTSFHLVKVVVAGTTANVYFDGTLMSSPTGLPVSSSATGIKAGFWFISNGGVISNWTITTP